MVRPFQSERNRYEAGRQLNDAARYEERRYPARAFLVQRNAGFRNAFDPADARTDQNPGAGLILITRGMPSGIIERLASSAHCKDDELVNLALFLRLHPLIRIVGRIRTIAPWNYASNLAGDVRHVEMVDFLGAALAVEQARPGRLHAATKRREHS